MANESTKWLYEQLTGKGYNVGKDVDEFDNLMRTNAESRRWAYETATNAGFNVGKDIDEFTSLVAPQPIQAAADVVANATNRIQPSVVGTEENGNNVPVVTSNQAAADEVVPVNDTQQSWTPSVQDKIRASYQMHTMLNDFNQKSRERIAQARRLTEPFTAEGRKKRSALAFQTQLAGSPTKVMGVMGSTPKSTADEVQGETEGATQQPQPDTQSPVPYGVEYVDGKPVTRWLMPDGSVTTNIAEADAAEYVAKQQRLHDTFANRMKQNGLDAEKQALYDAIVTGKNIAPERHKEIIDYMKSCGLDPKNNEHIKWVVKGDERSILVHRREIAGEKLKKLLARREQEEAKKDDDADFLTKLGRSANASVSHMHPTPQYNKSQINKDIEAAQAEVLLADKAVRTYDQHTGASKRNVFGKIVQGLGDALTDVNTYTFGVVDASVNKSVRDADPTSEYGRHLIETAQHAQELLATAPDPGGFYSGGRFMGSMVFDPFFYTSLGAGSLFKQGFTKAVTKTAFKDISKEAGERMLNQSLMGRLGGAAAFGAGNMAAFEGLGDMRQQLVDGGWTDSNGDFHEGFSMSHALARGGHGAIVGTGMGLWGAGFGNVANKAVQATNSAVGKVGIRAMQVPVSVIGEGTIFAMPEIIEYHTMDDDKFDRLYADKFGYADETDEEKRNKARDAARNAVSWDTWSESQAMVFAMKVAGKPMHALTNPGATIGHVTKTLSELRGKDVREHRSFAERVSQMMDRSPFDIVLTKEEREELRRAGYGELSELFRKDSNNGSTRTGVSPAEGAVEQYTERMEAEEIGGRRPEFDGYSEMERLMHDGSVSEAARAKAYYILTGHMLPMSTVTGYTKTAGEDGKITVNAVNARGEVVTSRIFRNEAKAQDEVDNITRQAELNTVDMGEGYAEAQAQMRVAETAFSEVGAKHNIISDGVRNIYEKYGMGEKLSDAELAIVNDVNELVAERMSENDTLRPESFRKRIQDNSGVDVDAALRKNAGSRTEQEQEAVNDYVDMLYKEAARDRKAREMWGDEYGQMREEERAERRRQYRSMLDGKLLEGSEPTPEQAEAQNQYEHGRELYGRFEEGDPTVQPDVDAIALRMQEAYEVFNDAFGAEAEEYMFLANENPWALFNNPELTIERQDAVLYYINAKAALDGVMDASNEAADRKRDEVEQSVAKRTHKDSGVIIPATMKVDDRQVYVVKGDVAMFPDGTGVDVLNSSESVIVMDAQTGEYEFTSPDQILKVSEVINPQEEMQSAHAVIEQEQMNIFGNNAVAPEEFTEQPRASTESLSDAVRTADVADAQGVPETAGTIPDEATELMAGNENAASAASNAETVQQTVLSRIPVDEQGEPMLTHENVDADTAWDGAVEFFGSDADAQSYVDAQVKNVTAAITAAEKAVEKVKPTGGMKKYKEDLAKARAAVDSAKGVLARWQAISQVSKGRKAEAEAEAAAQRAYEESITRGKEELKQAYDEVRDVPEAVEILRNMEPQSIDEVAALLLSGSKVLWNDEGVKRGVKSMLGYGEGERKGLFGLFATSKNGGETLERLAEDKMEELCNVYGIEYDNYDALTALTDVLGACRTRGDLTKYIQSRRIEQAIQAKDDFMRHIEEETERMSQEAYHMSVAERDAYEEQLFKDISRKEITDADIAEMNAIFADEIIERQRYEDNIRNEQRGAEDVLPSGTAVLQGTPADYGGRVPEASSGERGVAGNGSVDRAHGAAPEGTPGTVAQIAEPTEAQKAAGNYKMEHRRVDGYNISIENAKGSVRRGTGADGKPWETVMQNDYGYIRGTEGVDGDHIDVFLSDTPEKGDVFVVDQVNEDGSFDEHKVMYGFPTEQAAREAYLSNYEPGWTGLGAITHVSKDEFKKWIQSSRRKTKPFAEYKSVKAIEGNGMIGRSLTEQEATELIARMKAAAEVAPSIELTPENWIAQFGEDGIVETPVGNVKMGANQLLKLYSLKRTEYFNMIHPTLNTPDVIIEKNAPAEGAERDSKYLFVKTFIKSDGSRLVHFESVTVKRDGMEVSISSHEAEGKAIKKEMQNSKILHLSESLSLSSERYLTEAPTETEGPDLVPTSDNVSSEGKDNTFFADNQISKDAKRLSVDGSADKQADGAERSFDESNKANKPDKTNGANGAAYKAIVERGAYSVELRHGKDGDMFAVRLKKGARLSEWKDAVKDYGTWSGDGRGEILFDSYEAMTKFLEAHGEEVSGITDKAKWVERDKEANELLYAETGLREGQIWIGPDGTSVKIGARGFVKGPDGWNFAAAVTYPDGRKETTLTPARRISEFFKKNGFEQNEPQLSVGRNAARNSEVYEAAKGMLESAGIDVVEVSGDEAQRMLGDRVGDERLMGSRTDRKMAKIAEHYAEKSLDENQQAVVDVFSGKRDNVAIEAERSEGKRRVIMRQGDENKAGTKHSLFRHFEAKSNYINADDITLVPEIIAKGKFSVNGKKIAYDYLAEDGVRLRVTTEIRKNGHEEFTNLISNRKPQTSEYRQAQKGNTQLSARTTEAEVSDAKLVNNSQSDKSEGGLLTLRTSDGTVYGWTVGGKVYLNRDAMNPETPLHEYTHLWDEMVRRENPELWERGKELLKQTPEWNEVMDDPNYADIRHDEDAVASEVHSRLTGKRGAKRIEEMMKESAAEPDIVEKAKKFNLVHQLKRWLSDMFKGLKKTLSKWSKQDLRDLTAEDFADLTLRDLAEGVNPGQVSGDTRFQIMGERGIQRLDAAEEVSTRLDNLAVARDMEKDKVDTHTIRIATGWERGADGLWRYEIPDFEINPTGQARKNSLWVNLPWGKEFDRLTDKVLDGAELTREESIQFDELSERAEEMRKTYEESEIRYLDDYVIDESLFTAYPRLRQIRIEMYSDPDSGIGGTYYEKENLLRLNERLFDIGDLRSILVHEVQHAIQAEEGFARGGSVKNIRDMALNRIATNGYFLREFTPSQLYDLSQLRQKAEEKIKNGKYKRLSNAIKQVLKEARKYSSYVWLDRHDNNEDSYMTVYDTLNRYTADELYAAAQLDGHQLYNRVSGEVEARNAEKRMTMSDDERRQTLLRDTEDISREDQIFLTNLQNRRVSDKWLISKGRSKYQTDVSEPMMSVIERLSKKYRAAPIKEIKSVDEIDAEDLSKEAKEQIKLAHGEEGTQAVYCHENKKIYIFAGKYPDRDLDRIAAHENVHAAVDKSGLRDSEDLSYWHKGVISLFSDELPHNVDEILREGIPAVDLEDEFAAYTIPWIYNSKRRLPKILTTGDNRLIDLFKTICENVYGKEESEKHYILSLQKGNSSTFQNRSGGQIRGRGDAAERGNDTTGSPDSEAGGNLRGGNSGNREIADTHEPRKRYSRGRMPLMAGKSLFDWADSEAQARREVKEADEHAAAAIEADAAIDEYAEAYDGYLKQMRQAESDAGETSADEALRAVLEEQAAEIEAEVAERRERLEDSLRQYYLRENTPEDATRIARDMVNRVEAEVEIRQNGAAILRDILYGAGRADRNTVEAAEIAAHDKAIITDALDIADATARTAGGRISYNALGHLPDAAAGEFSYIERQFSRSGEFSFTGNGQIRSRGDVAYLFRALEDYSVEHVFAAFVKDGHVKVLHIGMGGPTSSSADMGAIRAGYDAFGADTIYLVHNHPSGMMKSSAPDRGLMLQLENAFGNEVPVEGIIIDTTSGRYVTFDSERDMNIEQRSDTGGNVNAEVMRFDKADRSRLPEKPEVIRNSSDVAQFVSAQRLGVGGKVSYLILSNGNEIIGNFHTEHGELTADGLAEEMVSVATKFGGRNVIVYGNTDLKGARRLGKEVERLSLNGVRLLDAMEVTNGLSRSANDEGMLREGSGVYGSQRVSESMTAGHERENPVYDNHGNPTDVEKFRNGREMSDGERLRAIRALEPIEVEPNEMSRDELREVYNNLPEVEKDGRTIEFYRSAFEKIYKEGGLFGQVVPVLDAVLDQSVLAYSERDSLGGIVRPDGTVHTEHPNVDSFDNYVGKVQIDGKEYYVRITVAVQPGQSGTHAVFVSDIDLYENTARSLSYPGSPRARVTSDGIVDAKLAKFFERASMEALELDKADRVRELSEKLNTPISIVTKQSDIDNLPSARHRRAKGFFDTATGEVVIVVPNNRDVADVDNTFVHEVVGHKGLRALVGEERFDEFLGEVYDHASNPIRKVIDKKTDDMVNAEADRLRTRKAQARERAGEDVNSNYYADMAEARVEAEAKREDFRKEATEEYMSDLGGRIGSEGFEKMSRDELTLWGKIKAKVQALLDKFLQGLKIAKSIRLNDKDLSYILYKSWKNLRKKGVFADAEDVVMRRRTGWDYEMLSDAAKLEDVNSRFNRELVNMNEETADRTQLSLGMPSIALRSAGVENKPMKLYGNKVVKKMKKHGFVASDLRNLPKAVAYPIAVFKGSVPDSFSVLTELRIGENNVLVSMSVGKGNDIDFNIISSTYGKKAEGVVHWINNGRMLYVDKEKALGYLRISAPIAEAQSVQGQDGNIAWLSSASQPVQQEIDRQVLDSAAKIIKDFENPIFEGDEDVKFRDGADYVERVPGMARAMYEKQIQSSMYQFTEAMQDSMRGLMEFYKAVESQGANRDIEDVASFENAYIAENSMSSKSHAEMEEYEHRILRPLLDIAARISVNKRGLQVLIDYMMAKHGLERNTYMRNEAIANGDESERDFAGLCGLTGKQDWQDAEITAQQMVDDYEATHSTDIAELWDAVNKATKTSLKKVYDCGLLSKAQFEKIRDMYKYYIPLRGFDEKTSDDVYGYLTSRNGVFSSPIKKAEGRKSKADDPLATIAYIAQNSIIQGNRNVMKQKFLIYVQNHPSDLASVNKLWLVHDELSDTWKPVFADIDESMTPTEVEQAVDAFEQRMEALSKATPDKYKRGRDAIGIPYRVVDGNIKEHQVLVKRNGESFVITINGNPRAAQAVNGLTNPDNDLNGAIGKVFNAANYINRKLSQLYTTRNPDFVMSNFIRDLIYSNTMVHVKENQGYAMRFHVNHAKVNPIRMVRLLRLYDKNKLDMHNPIHRMFYEFMHWGGETGYTIQRDLEQEKKLVDKLLKDAHRGVLNPMSVLNLIGRKLDQLNRGVENSARFAAFITSRKSGRDIQRSVYDAKEISVNFNKKGAGSKFMDTKGQTKVGKTFGFASGLGRSFYVFWNAAIQGTTNFAKAFKKRPGKTIMATTSLLLLGYILAALNDDGDDAGANGYYNHPKNKRRSNLMFRIDETWVTIPLPVEYRAFYGLGELAYSAISGREEYSDTELAKEISSQLSQILPIDFMEGGGGLHAFIPSAVKPLVESATNKSWTGLPIYKDTPFNKDMPEWTKAYPRTNAQLVGLSKWINEATGGNDYKPGWLNINPARLEYLLNGYFGGPANVVNKMVKTGEMMMGEREYDPGSILLVNRLVTMGDERTAEKKINSDFFKYLEEYKRTHTLLRKYEEEADRGSDKYKVYLDALIHSRDGARHDVMDEYMSDYNWLNRAIKDPDITDNERASYEDEMRTLKRHVVSMMKVAHDSVQVNKLKEQFAAEYVEQ